MKPYFKTENGKLYNGNVLDVLNKLPEKSINMCITSPPYWALRDYGEGTNKIWDGDPNCEHKWGKKLKRAGSEYRNDKGNLNGAENKKEIAKINNSDSGNFCQKCGAWKGQLGLEPNFDLYIKHLCDIFDGVKRVLRDDGTCWVNIGDTYWGSGAGTQYEPKTENAKEVYTIPYYSHKNTQRNKDANYKSKCLVQIPHRFAIEMTNRGWILRNTIIWHKPNCMPSSIKDRFTVDFEYMFFFSKNKKYYFEQQLEKAKTPGSVHVAKKGDKSSIIKNTVNATYFDRNYTSGKTRNMRTTWTINPKPFKEAHFAVYPEELITTPIKAGCPKEVCKKCGKPKELDIERKTMKVHRNKRDGDGDRAIGGVLQKFKQENPDIIKGYKPTCDCNTGFKTGTVLDIFMGAGTTGLVAEKMNRKWIGIDLNKEYCDIAIKRIDNEREQFKLEF